MKLFFLLIFLMSYILSNNQNINEIKSFNDLFKNQRKIYKLINDIKKIKKFFNLNDTSFNDKKNMDFSKYPEESFQSKKKKQKTELKESDNSTKYNDTEIHLLEFGNFYQKRLNLITFFLLMEFVRTIPSQKIFLSLKIKYKNKNETDLPNQEDQKIKAFCEIFEIDNSHSTVKYNCSSETKGEIEYISSYDDFWLDGIKYEMEESNLNLAPKDKFEACNNNENEEKNIYENNDIFYIRGKFEDFNENILAFKVDKKNNDETNEISVKCKVISSNENDYQLKCISEKKLIRDMNHGEEIIKKEINENIKTNKFNKNFNGISRPAVVIISFAFVVLFIFLLIFAIMLRRQTTEVVISIKLSME